ncbi:hypothetical protein GGP91_000274 [Salinibacter ruber]|nr:hypothetical protein [Salinibacter ruber]MCS4055657.1 hypothetical protein [Salinibacter ruber]MCS4059028.1 hypothetical protein [Salinibacter ruber]MCS4099368.1 hypothetical protein [Salinibacter ruber]MCS4159830.1 hypothetical protein [Salinibacter ruber]
MSRDRQNGTATRMANAPKQEDTGPMPSSALGFNSRASFRFCVGPIVRSLLRALDSNAEDGAMELLYLIGTVSTCLVASPFVVDGAERKNRRTVTSGPFL